MLLNAPENDSKEIGCGEGFRGIDEVEE